MENRSEFIANATDEVTVEKKVVAPCIPAGYVEVKTDGVGYVIRRKSDDSLFTWIPVWELPENGSAIDGSWNSVYRDQFGIRQTVQFERHPVIGMFANLGEQMRSIQKHKGFWISSYSMSLNSATGKLQSVAGERPVTNVDSFTARRLAEDFEKTEEVTSHLTMGCEFDSMWEWFWQTCDSPHELYEYEKYFAKKEMPANREPQITGTGYEVNNIYDVISDTCEWTQECRKGDFLHVFRDSHRFSETVKDKMATPKRRFVFADNKFDFVSFRVVLTLR